MTVNEKHYRERAVALRLGPKQLDGLVSILAMRQQLVVYAPSARIHERILCRSATPRVKKQEQD
jgi:hypothetical protein